MPSKPTLLVTGVSGNLGQRLLAQVPEWDVVGVDLAPPRNRASLRQFLSLDLGQEESTDLLAAVLRQSGAGAVVHLAFVIDPVRTGVLDRRRMWQINVAGTAHVMAAIAEANRAGAGIRQFIFPSSVSVYGPDFPAPADEEHPLRARHLPYALDKQESDEAVRRQAPSLTGCSTYVLRPHIYAGASMQNYLVGTLRGTPGGRSRMAAWLRRKNARLPLVLPFGTSYLGKRFQFVHVDDVARLIAFILRRPEGAAELLVLNVAGRGEPLTLEECAHIARQKVIRLPGVASCRMALRLLWSLGISSVPPEALPYMIGSYLMDTGRLRSFLGSEYEQVIRYTVEEALRDSFAPASQKEHTQRPAGPSERQNFVILRGLQAPKDLCI